MNSVDVSRVRREAKRLAEAHRGHAVELRIPPYAAVQLGTESGGPTHKRGTPPTVVEMDAETFLELIDGRLAWEDAVCTYRVSASGAHADLSSVFTA